MRLAKQSYVDDLAASIGSGTDLSALANALNVDTITDIGGGKFTFRDDFNSVRSWDVPSGDGHTAAGGVIVPNGANENYLVRRFPFGRGNQDIKFLLANSVANGTDAGLQLMYDTANFLYFAPFTGGGTFYRKDGSGFSSIAAGFLPTGVNPTDRFSIERAGGNIVCKSYNAAGAVKDTYTFNASAYEGGQWLTRRLLPSIRSQGAQAWRPNWVEVTV